MSDGGFDPCECIWSHDMAMQRLISLLRNSQSYCSDNECIQDFPGPSGGLPTGSDPKFFLFLMLWIVLALALFFLRPGSLRNRGDEKPRNSHQGNPPPPPAPIQ